MAGVSASMPQFEKTQDKIFHQQINGFLANQVGSSLMAQMSQRLRNETGAAGAQHRFKTETPENYIEAYRQILMNCAEKFFQTSISKNLDLMG